MKCDDVYLGKYEEGKLYLPVCSICLEPFEKYDRVLIKQPFENGGWMQQDIIHARCKQYTSITFNLMHYNAVYE